VDAVRRRRAAGVATVPVVVGGAWLFDRVEAA
jgi:hypothetical protein